MASRTPAPPFRLALVGCGQWGSKLAREFSRLQVLTAIVDEIEIRAQAVAELYRVPVMSWQDVLRDSTINAVAIATPSGQHCNMAIEALQDGKDVFIEKPLALSREEGEHIAEAAAQARRKVIVGHIFQYHPAFIQLRALVQEGGLGRIRHIYASRLAMGRVRNHEDALWSLAPHDMSMILSLVGEYPEDVTAVRSCHLRPHTADAVTAHLKFPGGIHAQINVSWFYPGKERKFVIIGEKGCAVFDDMKPWPEKLKVSTHAVSSIAENHDFLNVGDIQAVIVKETEPLAEECRAFVDCIQSGTESPTDIMEGLSVVRVLATIDDAMKETSRPTSEPSHQAHDIRPAETKFSVHETAAVDPGAKIGQGTRIWHFTHILSGATIGQDCNIGQNVMVGKNATVGNRCKIQNNVSVYEGVILEDGVFCGPSCVFTNVMTPRAEIERKSEFLPTIVRRGASIGANATVVCGVEIGAYALVGAGAVVTKSILPYALVVGNPARQIGWVGKAGERLGAGLICPRTGERYMLKGDQLVAVEVNGNSGGTNGHKPNVPLIDLSAQKSRIQADIDRRISKVLLSSTFINGPEVAEVEQKLSHYTGAAHVVGCASGTDALTLSLMALGLRPGDAVLVPTFSFIATVEPVALLGGVPIFVDIEPETFTIDPTLIDAGFQAAIGAGRRAVGIIAVDMFGHPADYETLRSQADKHSLWVIADAAQSFGASARGQKVGTMATITTTSFFPSKPLGCYGDGGAIFTNDPDLANTVRSLQHHGRGTAKFDSVRIGLNSRLDTIQAAVLLAKLEVFSDEVNSRQHVASLYCSLLEKAAVTTAVVRRDNIPAWASYTVRCKQGKRDSVQKLLHDRGISTIVYYPKPIHTMAAYSTFPVVQGGCPVAEKAAAEVLSLPFHPYLSAEIQQDISRVLQEASLEMES